MKRLVFFISFLSLTVFNPIALAYTDVTPGLTDYASEIEQSSIFQGNPNGTFNPTGRINRAEMATLLKRLADPDLIRKCERKSYPDVPQDSWYEEAVYDAQCAGLMRGDDKGTFRPSDPVSFAEMTVIFQRKYAPHLNSEEGKHWYEVSLNWASNQKTIPPTILDLSHQVTRAEVARMHRRIVDLSKDNTETEYLTAQEVLEGQKGPRLLKPQENPFVIKKEDEAELNELKEWDEVGKLPNSILDVHPFPWKYEEKWENNERIRELFDAKNNNIVGAIDKDELYPLFYLQLLNHYFASFDEMRGTLLPSQWKKFESYMAGKERTGFMEGRVEINKDWLTIPYREGYVGALNLVDGRFVLHLIKNSSYSEAVADDQGVLYAENNTWGCVTEEVLLKANLKLDRPNAPCKIVYQHKNGEETVLRETLEPFIDGLYTYWLRMNDKYLFVHDSIWECHGFCPPRVAIYDRSDTGEINYKETWRDNFSRPEGGFSFSHHTPKTDWVMYKFDSIELENGSDENFLDDINQFWKKFWGAHPELMDPQKLYEMN